MHIVDLERMSFQRNYSALTKVSERSRHRFPCRPEHFADLLMGKDILYLSLSGLCIRYPVHHQSREFHE